MSPSWWTWRDRWAARLGPWFWPAWYIAPRSTRDRWADFADAMYAKGDWLDLEEADEVLRRHGWRITRGDDDSGPT